MKVILSVTPIRMPLTGIGRYTLSLARALHQHPAIGELRFWNEAGWVDTRILDFQADPAATARPPSVWQRLRAHAAGYRLLSSVYGTLQPYLARPVLRRESEALLHSPNYHLPDYAGPSVITIHDISHLRFPQFHPPSRIAYMNQSLPAALSRTDFILVDTAVIRDEVLEAFNWSPERIAVAHLGVSEAFHAQHAAQDLAPILQQWGLVAQGYALYVGTIEPRKNLPTLLQAYARLPDELRRSCPLVLAGDHGWRSESIHAHIQQAQAQGWLTYLQYVPDTLLPSLYAGARVFVYPSHYEGFGLPVLEAMASGVPIVISTAPTLVEVAGGVGFAVQTEDTEAWTATLEQALTDSAWQARARAAGLERARQFSWAATADKTVQVYERLGKDKAKG